MQAEDSLGALATRTGKAINDVLYDYLIENGGTGFAAILSANYQSGNLDVVREILAHPETATGLAHAGAHVNLICDGSMPTTQLKHWGGGARLLQKISGYEATLLNGVITRRHDQDTGARPGRLVGGNSMNQMLESIRGRN